MTTPTPALLLALLLATGQTALADTNFSAGNGFAVVIKPNGTLWAWGDNSVGALGDNNTNGKAVYAPLMISGSTDWATVSARGQHTAAVKSSGTRWAWGENDCSLSGANQGLIVYAPTQVGTDSDWQLAATGSADDMSMESGVTLAIKQNGTLWGWGCNNFLQLGADVPGGAVGLVQQPVQIGSDSNWQKLAVGQSHVVALKTDGSLWIWGYGELGFPPSGGSTGNAIFQSTPVQIASALPWQTIAAGGGTTLAIRSDGTLWVWGANDSGQLGDGTTTDALLPEQVGTASDWVDVVTNYNHVLALRGNKATGQLTLWGWGANNVGQIGTALSTGGAPVLVPTQIGTDSDWQSIAVGYHSSMARKSDGSFWNWGATLIGGQNASSSAPQAVPALASAARATTSSGSGGGCALAGANARLDPTLWLLAGAALLLLGRKRLSR